MAKIVYLSDLAPSGSGYMSLSLPLCEGLSKLHEVKVIGFSNEGKEHNFDFPIFPVKNLPEIIKTLTGLWQLWNFDYFMVALDITLQEQILNKIQDRPFKYVGIFPVEADPLCFSWASLLMTMDKQFIISDFGTKEAHKKGVMSAEHIQIGIDTKAWRKPLPGEKEKLRKAFGIGDDTKVVLTNADNQERKNFFAHFEAFSEFSKKYPNSKYILITREHNLAGWKLRDLAIEYKIADKLMIVERGMPFANLWSYYAMSDCLLNLSKAEGLCLPVLEAMSCFPENTQVEAKGVLKGLSRLYSGELITIQTERTQIRVTPEHPFWTSSGWQYAKDLTVGSLLWYNSPNVVGEQNAKKGIQNIYTGRIKDVVQSIWTNNSTRYSKDYEQISFINSVASSSDGTKKENRKQIKFSLSSVVQREPSISSRNYRWGGNDNNTKNGRKKENQLEANGSDFKYIRDSVKLAINKVKLSFDLGKSCISKSFSSSLLYILHRRNESSSFIRILTSLFSDKTRPHESDYRVLQTENESINRRPDYAPPDVSYFRNSGAKFEAICKISTETVKDITVYNLSTISGCYLAQGYVVHNCGIPVIATDCTAMMETCADGRGILVPWHYRYVDPFGNGYRYLADYEVAAAQMIYLFESGKQSEFVDKARLYVESRTWDIPVQQIHEYIMKDTKNEQKEQAEPAII